jgi:hypothetical protein
MAKEETKETKTPEVIVPTLRDPKTGELEPKEIKKGESK